jgi:hypothetical protein
MLAEGEYPISRSDVITDEPGIADREIRGRSTLIYENGHFFYHTPGSSMFSSKHSPVYADLSGDSDQ